MGKSCNIEIARLECDPKVEDEILLHMSPDRHEGCLANDFPAHELKRRVGISSDPYRMQLLIDGNVVGKTKVQQLIWPSLTIDFKEQFRCRLHREPTSVCLRLIQPIMGGLFGNTVLCSTFVGVPEHRNTPIDHLNSNLAVTHYQFCGSKTADNAQNLKGSISLRIWWASDREKKRGQREERNGDTSSEVIHGHGKHNPRISERVDPRILSINYFKLEESKRQKMARSNDIKPTKTKTHASQGPTNCLYLNDDQVCISSLILESSLHFKTI